jgi:hypothetical protein
MRGTAAKRSAAQARTDVPPNTSPTAHRRRGDAGGAQVHECAQRACQRQLGRIAFVQAHARRCSEQDHAVRPLVRARSNKARSASPCAAPTLPPRKALVLGRGEPRASIDAQARGDHAVVVLRRNAVARKVRARTRRVEARGGAAIRNGGQTRGGREIGSTLFAPERESASMGVRMTPMLRFA